MANNLCAACLYNKKTCPPHCVFRQVFSGFENVETFCILHNVFHTENLAKWFRNTPPERVAELKIYLFEEAGRRLADPLGGSAKLFLELNAEVQALRNQIATQNGIITNYENAIVLYTQTLQQESIPIPQYQYQ